MKDAIGYDNLDEISHDIPTNDDDQNNSAA